MRLSLIGRDFPASACSDMGGLSGALDGRPASTGPDGMRHGKRLGVAWPVLGVMSWRRWGHELHKARRGIGASRQKSGVSIMKGDRRVHHDRREALPMLKHW